MRERDLVGFGIDCSKTLGSSEKGNVAEEGKKGRTPSRVARRAGDESESTDEGEGNGKEEANKKNEDAKAKTGKTKKIGERAMSDEGRRT